MDTTKPTTKPEEVKCKTKSRKSTPSKLAKTNSNTKHIQLQLSTKRKSSAKRKKTRKP
jgi:hypothetical protein